MAESLKNLVESVGNLFTEAGKNVTEYVQEGIKSIEKITAEGQKLHDAIMQSVSGLQQGFRAIMEEAERLIEQNRTNLVSAIDRTKSTANAALDEVDPGKAQAHFQNAKDSLGPLLAEIKGQAEKDAEKIGAEASKALQDLKQLLLTAIDSAKILKVASEKTMAECRERLDKEIEKLKATAEDVGRRYAKDFSDAIDTISKEMTKAIDQVKSIKDNATKGAADAKEALEKAAEDVKGKAGNSIDGLKKELGKSIENIEKQSENAVGELAKDGDKAVTHAQEAA
ncbi:apolipoprotein A-IV-like [Photinus pyralis]|uniref:apolipoprotein A-IV-like n=1 Tax=Photinus pyralis TaxID=7054 RepID=UPI001267334E|nr:apolipoprotein A-IV-like [Photinus pyralis]